MEFVDLTPALAPEWDRVVYHSDDGWAFSLAGWLDMVTPIWQMENRSFAIRENGRLVAVIPLHRVPAAKRLASSGWGHGGPVILAGVSPTDRRRLWRAALSHVKEIAVQLGAGSINIMISPLCQSSLTNRWGVNPMVEFGFADVSTHTRIVNLCQEESELWFGLAQDARQQVKRARAGGYTVRRCSWKELVDEYYRVHVETYNRTGVKPHPKAYFEGIANLPDDRHVLWVAFTPNGIPVAFHNDARYGVTALYHTGCSKTVHLKSGINYWLFWEALLGAKADGCEWYETGEAFPQAKSGKDKGLNDFKGKFGGELHRFFKGQVDYSSVLSADVVAQPITVQPATPTNRKGLHNWLRATCGLSARLIGSGITNWLQKTFIESIRGLRVLRHKWAAGISRIVHSINVQYINPPIRFMVPYWSDEVRLAASQTQMDLDQASDEFVCQFSIRLDLSSGALVVPTSSGRTALLVALRALKIAFPERNKVLLPTYGCRGTFDPIVQAGLVPVFVDITRDLVIDVDQLSMHLDSDVLACLIVHLCGMRMDADPVIQQAHKFGITVIEDHCQSMGAEIYYPYGQTKPDLMIYSFGMGKSMMASAGGALVALSFQSEVEMERKNLEAEQLVLARQRFQYYHDLYFLKRAPETNPAVEVARLSAYEYLAMSTIDARLLVEQLKKLNTIIERRQKNAQMVISKLRQFPALFSIQPSARHVYTKLSVCLRDRAMFEEFQSFMAQNGIELEGMYVPLHVRDFGAPFRKNALPIAESIYPRVVNIPVRPNLTARQVGRIADVVEKFGAAHS